jgi:hypothetical protein
MKTVRRGFALATVFGIGLLLGTWLLLSPWVLGIAASPWSWAVRTSVWGGLALIALSALAMVVVPAVSVQQALNHAAAERERLAQR